MFRMLNLVEFTTTLTNWINQGSLSTFTPVYSRLTLITNSYGATYKVFHVYLKKFENAVTHLFLVIFGNNWFPWVSLISRNTQRLISFISDRYLKYLWNWVGYEFWEFIFQNSSKIHFIHEIPIWALVWKNLLSPVSKQKQAHIGCFSFGK